MPDISVKPCPAVTVVHNPQTNYTGYRITQRFGSSRFVASMVEWPHAATIHLYDLVDGDANPVFATVPKASEARALCVMHANLMAKLAATR